MTAASLLLLATLGAMGVYFALPGGRLLASRAGLILVVGVIAALLSGLGPQFDAGGRWVFYGLAAIGLWSAVRVVTHAKPVYSALYFILVILTVAGLLVLMQAEFLAAALVIIYAGAILVTYVFVIMLAQQSGGSPRYDSQAREPLLGALTGFVLLALVAGRLAGGDVVSVPLPPEVTAGTVSNVGTSILTKYAVAVQIAAVLLLAAMVGAVAIARRRATDPAAGEAE